MIAWIVFAALVGFSLFGPVINRGGVVANHNPIRLRLPYDITTLEQGQHPEGRKVQEVGEWRFISLVSLIPALAVVWFVQTPIGALAGVVGWFVGKLALYAMPFIDTAGHGAEILTAEDDGLWSYREQEAKRMLWSRPNMTVDEVLVSLDRWEWLSKIMRRLAAW